MRKTCAAVTFQNSHHKVGKQIESVSLRNWCRLVCMGLKLERETMRGKEREREREGSHWGARGKPGESHKEARVEA